jgi:stage II sporulation protein M
MNIIDFYANLLRQNRSWLVLALKIFTAGAVIGAVTFVLNPGILETILNAFAEKFGENPPLDANLAKAIFTQNLSASLIALLGGVVFGLTSFAALLLNGFLMGFIVLSLFFMPGSNYGQSATLILGGLVPHGIFELPAFFMGSAFGMKLGLLWISQDAKGNRWASWKQSLKQALQILPVIILLLVIAAFVEVFVSGMIVDNL